MEAYFVSDIHLKSVNERNGQILLRFLHSLSEKANSETHLFLLGDIFDLWLSNHAVFIERFQSLIAPLREMKKKGAHIYYFEGNHDLHLDNFWAREIGAQVFTRAHYFQLGQFTIRCEHGDEINLEDLAYLRLRKFVRHPVMQSAAHKIPGKMWDKLGQYLSQKSRGYSQDYRQRTEAKLVNMIRAHAHRSYCEKNFDYIVSGHMHVQDDYEFKEGKNTIRSFNLGSWYDSPKILKLTENHHEWLNL